MSMEFLRSEEDAARQTRAVWT